MADSRPNVLLFICHDLGTMLGCHGADPALRTPRLDRFATEGVCCVNHFCTAAFCSPSRGGVFTGQVPHVNGLMGLVNCDWDLPEGVVHMGRRFRDAGYRTDLVGFQHEAKDPTRLGFEDIWRESVTAKNVADETIRRLADRGDDDRPFYMQIGTAEVHRPYPEETTSDVPLDDIRPLPYHEDTELHREDLRDFYGHIEGLDAQMGRILDAVDDAGLRENTIVVFTTDHGIAFPLAKGTLYDPGMRTTLLMRWPEGFDGGRRPEPLLSNVDLLPTLMEACGIEIPDGIQGRSFLPLLRGEPYAERDWVFAELNTPYFDIRRAVRTRHHKLIHNAMRSDLMRMATDLEASKTRKTMGEFRRPRPAWEFYDLREDPLERNNLAGRGPADGLVAVADPAQRAAALEMAETLLQFQVETKDPLLRGALARPSGEYEIITNIYRTRNLGDPDEIEAW